MSASPEILASMLTVVKIPKVHLNACVEMALFLIKMALPVWVRYFPSLLSFETRTTFETADWNKCFLEAVFAVIVSFCLSDTFDKRGDIFKDVGLNNNRLSNVL